MIRKSFLIILLMLIISALAYSEGSGQSQAIDPHGLDLTAGEILDRVEAIYTASEFSADFIQASTIKAMQITDSAAGKLFVKYPAKMRWEYEEPERQIIVTDGLQLWVYRPDDHQVLVGRAATFFGAGKGAGFLSDIRRIRQDFEITLEEIRFGDYYNLMLVPLKKDWDLVSIHILVSKATFHITQVYTYNAYDDVTRIEIVNPNFESSLDDALFTFDIPKGVDVLELD